MNTYNIFDPKEQSTILFHAIAENEEQVKELANENNISLENMIIELERTNVKDELGRAYEASIRDAIVR